MAKISFLLFVVALVAFLHAYEAHRVVKFDTAFEKDLHKAREMINKDLRAKKMSIKDLASELEKLSKSELLLKRLGNAYKNDMNLSPYEMKLKKFTRTVNIKSAPAKKKSVSIIQSILKDLGLNRGKKKA